MFNKMKKWGKYDQCNYLIEKYIFVNMYESVNSLQISNAVQGLLKIKQQGNLC